MTTAVAERKETKAETKEQMALSRDPWQNLGLPSLKRMRQEFDDLWGKFFSEVPTLWTAERGDSRGALAVARAGQRRFRSHSTSRRRAVDGRTA